MLCIGLFTTKSLVAQSCPPTGFSNGTSLYFFYDTGTSACVDRPLNVSVGASVFSRVYCDDSYSRYDLTSGSALSNPSMFTAGFGYGTCEYTNGTLTNEVLSIEDIEALFNGLKVYPNPLVSGNDLFVKFNTSVSATLNLYDITGKSVIKDQTSNSMVKPMSLVNLPNGVYLLKISIDNLAITKKVVVMR